MAPQQTPVDLPVHPTLVHPRTGEPLRAVGVLPSGRVVWPIMGGDGTEDDANDTNTDDAETDENNEDADEVDADADADENNEEDADKGKPKNGPVKPEKDDQGRLVFKSQADFDAYEAKLRKSSELRGKRSAEDAATEAARVAGLSDIEKAQEAQQAAETRVTTYQDTVKGMSVQLAALTAGAINDTKTLNAVARLADLSGVDFNDDVLDQSAVTKAVEAVLTEYPAFKATPTKPQRQTGIHLNVDPDADDEDFETAINRQMGLI